MDGLDLDAEAADNAVPSCLYRGSPKNLHSLQSSSSAIDLHTYYRARGERRQQHSENDGYYSRPNSFASMNQLNLPHCQRNRHSYHQGEQQQQEQQQQQQQKKRTSKKTLKASGARKEKKEESTESFDRICSLLTHLISDASTALERAPGSGSGTAVIRAMNTAVITPLVYADSENSEDDGRSDDVEAESVDDEPKQHQQYRHTLEPNSDRDIRSMDSRVSRTRSSGFLEKNISKRRSLFLELQDCQPDYNEQREVDGPHKESVVVGGDVKEKNYSSEPDVTALQIPSWQSTERTAMIRVYRPEDSTTLEDSTTPTPEDLGSYGTGPSPPVFKGLRRCASFPSMHSDMVEMQNAGELQQVIQCMDAELDKAVETIDGLTRDLLAVATHQSWMQMKLEKSSQSQAMQNEGMEGSFDEHQSLESGWPSLSSDATVSFPDDSDGWVKTSLWNRGVPIDCSSTTTSSQEDLDCLHDANQNDHPNFSSPWESELSSQDFSRYLEALEKIVAMGQDPEDRDRTLYERPIFPGLDDAIYHKANISQRSSGSSYTLNNDISFPMSSSDRSLEACFNGLTDPNHSKMVPAHGDVSTQYNDEFLMSGSDMRAKGSIRSTLCFTNLDWGLWRRATMPAAWPTSPRPELRPAENEKEKLSFEDSVAFTNILNMYASLILLFFWTIVFAVAVLFVVPSLAELSGQHARRSLEEMQQLLIRPCHDQDDGQRAAWRNPSTSIADDTPKPSPTSSCYRRPYLASQGEMQGPRNRRKLNHQRLRRTLMTSPKAVYANLSRTAFFNQDKNISEDESWPSRASSCSSLSETTAANTSAILDDLNMIIALAK
ncbi:hypothetical protein BGZ65_013042 [Modicella reniformis]|uniref:Uncharacterized protein n=1 Tax=Modicella reniformis TaxID=1440133 RepID=A0A9P6SNU2_9FUNG|nr:hypothetical protein BGZ65_013042 [Modicella reniformis]